MSQFFEENKTKWFTTRDIATYLEVEPSKVSAVLKQMRKYKEVKWKTRQWRGNDMVFEYKYKT